MTGVPLQSLPTGPGVSTGRGELTQEVDLATNALEDQLEPDAGAVVVGTTAVVVAASLLDFLR